MDNFSIIVGAFHVSESSRGNTHFLPDSRLREKKGVVKGELVFQHGDYAKRGVEVVEWEPIFCPHCGSFYGYVTIPISFTCWLCKPCFEKLMKVGGLPMGMYALPEDEFNRNVAEEVRARFGRDLTAQEIDEQAEHGNLGPALEK